MESKKFHLLLSPSTHISPERRKELGLFSVAHFSLCVGERLSQTLLSFFSFRCHINNDDTSRNHSRRSAEHRMNARDHEKSLRHELFLQNDSWWRYGSRKKVNGSQSENLFIWWSSGRGSSQWHSAPSFSHVDSTTSRALLTFIFSMCSSSGEWEAEENSIKYLSLLEKLSRSVCIRRWHTQKKAIVIQICLYIPVHNMTMMMIDMRERWVDVSRFARMYCR